MSKDNSALEEQLERIQTEINETTDPERLKYIATELVSTLKYLSEDARLIMVPHYLSDITEEPEKCQHKTPGWGDCEHWALAGEFFCEEHVDPKD